MKPQFVLPFEKPIVDLEDQLAKLETEPNPTPVTLDLIRTRRVEIVKRKREVFEIDDRLLERQHKLRLHRWDHAGRRETDFP